jgi:hypothetical protein
VWLARGGRQVSTHDLIDMRFTLFAGPRGKPWRDAARAAAASLDVPLDALTIGPGADVDDPEARWLPAYGIEADGAVLVRPDAHVAWRSGGSASDPQRELEAALRAVLVREPSTIEA